MNLPSHIKPSTKDAYNFAYTALFCKQPKDIRKLIDEYKNTDVKHSCREVNEFLKEVRRMAEYEMSAEDLKALERSEKIAGTHVSQTKKEEIKPDVKLNELPKDNQNLESKPKLQTPPNSGENPS